MKNKTKSGFFRKNLTGELAYYSFVPAKLMDNIEINLDKEIVDLLVSANTSLKILDDRAKNIPDMDLFISMYVQKEALLSSQIEGTQVSLEDIFYPELDENINSDINEVVNYVKATNYSINRLNSLPLSNRLLLETHEILMEGTRGEEKNPGEFRQSQNWIGGQGSSLRTARYVPPNIEDMKKSLYDLEEFMNYGEDYDYLINAGLIHYQFETIHPFLDGNGRIGRLLIVLYLLEKNVIQTPALYLSYYLKNNRIEYYDRMMEVREKGNYEQWLKFFIKGIEVSSKSALETAEDLITIRDKDQEKIMNQKYTKRTEENMLNIFHYIQAHPIIDISSTAKDLGLAYNTVATAVERFEKLEILKQRDNNKRNRVFVYEAYLDRLAEGTELV